LGERQGAGNREGGFLFEELGLTDRSQAEKQTHKEKEDDEQAAAVVGHLDD